MRLSHITTDYSTGLQIIGPGALILAFLEIAWGSITDAPQHSAHVAAAYLVLSAVNRALEHGRVRRIERRPADA